MSHDVKIELTRHIRHFDSHVLCHLTNGLFSVWSMAKSVHGLALPKYGLDS